MSVREVTMHRVVCDGDGCTASPSDETPAAKEHDPHCGSPSGRVCLNPRCRCRCHLPETRREESWRHQSDTERGGCTCGFCAWSVEHVAIMSVREAVRRAPTDNDAWAIR